MAETPPGSGNPFWDFSLALYGKPGVAPALLGLQDRRGLDVNLLLYCCWKGETGHLLSQADLAAARDATIVWQHEVIHPIRAVRRRLKAGFPPLTSEPVEALRRRLGDIEIEAERVAQDALAELKTGSAVGGEGGAGMAAANLRNYFRMKEVPIGVAEENALLMILRGAFPGVALDELGFTSD
jgi:uncharacterized protein (TIGR02444 family)